MLVDSFVVLCSLAVFLDIVSLLQTLLKVYLLYVVKMYSLVVYSLFTYFNVFGLPACRLMKSQIMITIAELGAITTKGTP